MQRFVILFLSLFFLAACAPQASFGDAIVEGEPSPVPTNVIPSRPIYDVQRGDVIDQRTYVGRISALSTEQLNFSIDGRIAETYFSVGADVVAGDVLARLDTTELENELLNAQEDLALAQSLLDSATRQIDFDRERAQLEIDLAQVNLDYANLQASEAPSAEATLLVQQREIELELAELDLQQIEDGVDPALEFDVTRAQDQVDHINGIIAQATLSATMDGRLVSFPFEAGDSVTAFQAVGVVADLTELEVTNVIDNTELNELTEGLPAVLQRANAPDAVFEGTLYLLPQPFGLGSDGLVHVRFNNPSEITDFELGERVSYIVTIAERHDVLWLPIGAIRQFGRRNFVVIQDNGVERRVDVQLGLQGNDRVEILEGLEENQRVIAP